MAQDVASQLEGQKDKCLDPTEGRHYREARSAQPVEEEKDLNVQSLETASG